MEPEAGSGLTAESLKSPVFMSWVSACWSFLFMAFSFVNPNYFGFVFFFSFKNHFSKNLKGRYTKKYWNTSRVWIFLRCHCLHLQSQFKFSCCLQDHILRLLCQGFCEQSTRASRYCLSKNGMFTYGGSWQSMIGNGDRRNIDHGVLSCLFRQFFGSHWIQWLPSIIIFMVFLKLFLFFVINH